MRKLQRIALTASGILVVLFLGSSAGATWWLTRRSRPIQPEPLPSAPGWSPEVLSLTTSDGQRLGAWLTIFPESATAVVVLHGHGGCRSATIGLQRWLASQRITTLAVTLRSHGDSTGETHDFGWSNCHDVVASFELLERRCPGTRIFVIGNSLGSAAAVYAARELGHRAAGYMLEAPYRDAATATRHRLNTYLPPLLDEVAYAGLWIWSHAMLEPSLAELSLLDRITDIPAEVPVLLLSGRNDPYAPIAEVDELRLRAGPRARLVPFDGVGHSSLCRVRPEEYRKVVLELLSTPAR